VAFSIQVVTESDDDLLNLLGQLTSGGKDKGLSLLLRDVKFLKDGDGEGSGLSSTRLGLGNDIVILQDGKNGTLLNGGGTFETNYELPSRCMSW
jgi:hypothetical protein